MVWGHCMEGVAWGGGYVNNHVHEVGMGRREGDMLGRRREGDMLGGVGEGRDN